MVTVSALAVAAAAQTPTQAPAAPQPTTPAPSSKPQTTPPQVKPQPRVSSAAVTLSVQATNRSGDPISDVMVRTSGPVERTGSTGQDGTVVFRSMRAGTYRLRFESEAYTTFEREVTMRNQAMDVSVALTAAPPPPKPVAPAPVSPTPPPAPARTPRAVAPHIMSIADYLDHNLVSSSEPSKTSLLGCAEGGTAVLLQVRDPLSELQHAESDEILYVVAGDGVIRMRNEDRKIVPGHFALVPRGMAHSLRRSGRNPLILLSVMAGEPCKETGPPAK